MGYVIIPCTPRRQLPTTSRINSCRVELYRKGRSGSLPPGMSTCYTLYPHIPGPGRAGGYSGQYYRLPPFWTGI